MTELPMMATKEIEIIDKLLTERQPKYCLELGSGISTLYFPREHETFIRYWRAIEHNGHWYKSLRLRLPDNADILWTRDDSEETYFKEALLYKYDFVLIDGLDRSRAIKMLPELLYRGGFALLHDSGRKEYEEINKQGKVLIEGEEPYKGYYKHRGLTLFEN